MHLSGNEIDRDALPPDSYFLLQQRRLTSLALGAANNGRYCRKSQPITSRHELSDRNQIVFFLGGGRQSPILLCGRKPYHFVHTRSNWFVEEERLDPDGKLNCCCHLRDFYASSEFRLMQHLI